MKKLVILLSIFFLFSCTKEVIENEDTSQILSKEFIESADLKSQIVYANYHLLKVGAVISENKKFRKVIKNNLLSKNNSNGLSLNKLMTNINNKSISISEKDKKKLTESINSFKDIDNEDWNIKISLPYINEQKENFLSKSGENTEPIIVVSSEDVPNPMGYKGVDDYGNMLPYEPIDESKAHSLIEGGNTLMIIAIDDDVISGGYDSDSDSGSGSSNYNGVDYLKLGNMKVKQNKEDWHNGASEIHLRGFWDPDTDQYAQFFTYNDNDENGQYMARFKRRWIRRGHVEGLNFKMLWDWDNVDNITSNQFFSYVIFEHDGWPAPVKTINLPPLPSGVSRTTTYRSWQYVYPKATVRLHGYNNQYDAAGSHYVNNAGIEYNFYRDYN